MQEELKTLQKSLGITFVFVTHDQGEALSMANRIAVFNDGKVMQVGAPEEIYQRPNSRFVADFVGSSNVLPPDFVARHGATAAGRACDRRRYASPGLGRHRGHRRFALLSRRHDASRSRYRVASASTRCCPPASPCRPKARPSASASSPHDLHLMDDPG